MLDPFSIGEESKKKIVKNFSKEKDIDWFSSFKGESLKLVINEKIKLLFFAILFFFILVIFFRLFGLQIIEGGQYLKMAEGNEIRIERIPFNRGIIYDRHGQPLVKNIFCFSLYFYPEKFPQPEEEKRQILEKVEKILPGEKLTNLNFQEKGSGPILIKKNLSHQEVILFEIERESLQGFVLKTEKAREYTKGAEFSHLLGYTGAVSKEDLERGYSFLDEVGKVGIEKYYEEWLRGQDGKKRIESGLRDEQQIVSVIEPPQDGMDIVLSIDFELQKVLAANLEKWAKIFRGTSGAGVIVSPQNGQVLALVSYPFFDNNLFSQGISVDEYQKIISDPNKPLFFRAVNGEYKPGSAIKSLIGLAALEEKIITEKTSFLSTGGVRAGQWFFADWRHGGHGQTNLIKALADSVNTFFYRISAQDDFFNGLGPDKIAFYLKSFGIGEKTGIDLSSEARGFVPTPAWKREKENEPWFLGDSYNLGIGHGYLRTTPLQLTLTTAAIANNGKMVAPKIIKKIIESDGSEIYQETKTWQLPFEKENFEIIKKGMREVVLTGTGRFLSDFPLEVAGKTGTIEAGAERLHSLFTAFVPMNNPEIAITIIVEEGGEGSGPALRATKETLEWWYENRYKNNEL